MINFEAAVPQLVLIAILMWLVVDYFRRFPNPPRLTRPFLSPEKRWPVRQLWEWIEDGKPDPGFIRFFMRDPDRKDPSEPGLTSPVDGTVLDDICRDGRRYLVISLNVWDVHVARSPCSGQVHAIHDHGDVIETNREDPLRDEPFYFLREKASPKQKYLEVASDWGTIRVRFITSYLSRRIEFFCSELASLERGQRIGRMLFGSTCVLEFDDKFKSRVERNARVIGGETIVVGGVPK